MALPKLQVQTSKKKSLDGKTIYTLRPFSVKEQKILLVAKESIKNEDNPVQRVKILIDSLEQVLGNCIIDHDIDSIPAYDFPFIMLELRRISVDNITQLQYRCKSLKDDGSECGNQFSVNVDLSKIQTKGTLKTANADKAIQLDDVFSVFMRYPTFGEFKTIYSEELNDIQAIRMFIDYVFETNGSEIYPISESSDEELEEFITDAGPKVKNIQEWINDMPKPYFKMEYICKGCGNKKVIELKDLNDFF